jgi:hypothetical protein
MGELVRNAAADGYSNIDDEVEVCVRGWCTSLACSLQLNPAELPSNALAVHGYVQVCAVP